MKVQLLSMNVDNEFGVLTRITSLIRREGWNIKSLAVAETLDPAVSCITVCIECLDSALSHVRTRLGKLDCVKSLTVFDPQKHERIELAVVSVLSSDKNAAEACAQSFGARLLCMDGGRQVFEITKDPVQIDAFINNLASFGTVNVTRSGAIMIEKSVNADK
ncbi:MAG: acetolactate synthase small subunit [Bacillota bacterium]